MKILIIHGQSHEGSTCHIARQLAEKVGGDLTEFFLPRDFGEFCLGCTTCFNKGHELCPHYKKLKPITDAIDAADLIILESPVYVYHATGQMKTLLDHYGYRWMAHRPVGEMFRKQSVCIATSAGAGQKSTLKDMKDSLYFWGCGKYYQLGFAVHAISWDTINDKTRAKIDKKTTALAKKINKKHGHVKPGFKTKAFFNIARILHKKGLMSPADQNYWKENGWFGKARPWK